MSRASRRTLPSRASSSLRSLPWTVSSAAVRTVCHIVAAGSVERKGARGIDTWALMCHSFAHMPRTIASTDLAEWLNDQLEQHGLGVRTLAKRINPGEPEVARRMLNRCLFDGSYPSEENRRAIAVALEIPVAEVPALAPFRGEAA